MPDTIIENVLNGKLDTALLIKWLNNEPIEDAPDDCVLLCCTKSDFVAYFLTYLRNQTDSILQTNSNAVQILQNATPEKLLHSRRKHHRSISEPTSDERSESVTVKTDPRSHDSPNRDRKKTGRRVKTKLFMEDKNNSSVSVPSDESRLSTGVEQIALSSTPMKNGLKLSDFPIQLTSPVTPRSFIKDSYERCDTPRLSHRHSRSHDKSCLGDYLVNATKSSKKKTKKNTSNDEIEKIDLDLSNSEIFPEIGARKSSSLRSEKRRIKPTNIDKSQKSLSLNSFNMECFQQPPLALEENSAFKQQKVQLKESSNSFEAERNILKQERHKLMEKFNILNTSTPTKTIAMPQIRISQKESVEVTQNHIKADVNKILLKEKIDLLVEIYNILLKNNLILSINTELYFLISILVSKQVEEEYRDVESKLMDNNINFLLKSIHNSTYFAVKSLWNQRMVLEVILDKNSLKTLGENKRVRSFTPELAKFVLNTYSVRCEAPLPRAPRALPAPVVTFNCETDNADNFPTTQAFHLFKKQRDLFYDIIRWYQATTGGESRSTFRARVKTLLSGATATNHAHLASLFIAHMLASCLPSDAQESKLSKLHRRLTCPTSTESNRLPHFTSNELFYKELITHAENESFRVHLKDALTAEIILLDGTHLAVDDRGNANMDITREYLQLAKKLSLLAKFLGYLTSLPYSHTADVTNKNTGHITNNKELNYVSPKEKVQENSIGLRNNIQPTIDLKGLLQNAIDNSRLSITLPWMANYLSMLDYTTLRLNYYNEIIKSIYDIYKNNLKEENLKKNTVVYLKSILGWLFDLPHFPIDSEANVNSVGSDCVDNCDLVDESTILELCPCLREINTLLSTCRLSKEQRDMGSFRHITPLSLTDNSEDRIKNKEQELQNRLEEELLKSQPSSTRRVLEMVVERVTSAAVKEFTARELPAARERARELALRTLAASAGEPQSVVVQAIQSMYKQQVEALGAGAGARARRPLRARAAAALAALLPPAPPPLAAAAARRATRAFLRWIADHTATTAILCKDIEAEVKTLMSMNEMNISPGTEVSVPTADIAAPDDVFLTKHVSVAEPLLHLKEHICLLLDGESPPHMATLLATCATSCSPHNMFCRAPSRRAIMQLTVDLAVVYVSKKPEEVTAIFLNQLHAVWNTCCPDRKHHAPEEISLPERRDDISPEPRNFEDDERMATPLSDDENKIVNGIDQEQKPVVPTSQPINPKWQPTKQLVMLQPINTKPRPGYAKSQPASPMFQPVTTKWLPLTSKSQPVSPKLQPVGSKSQPFSPKWQFSPKCPTSPTVKSESDVKNDNESNEYLLECFDRILCSRNIMLLSATKCQKSDVWVSMATLLVFLLKNDYLSEDSLTEQCLAVYRQDWPQSILESLSACMKSVSSRWSKSSSGKFTLFLDFLAEYCGDMDYEPLD